jgi:DNA-binding beta-propeller fold protein YncE
MRAVRSCRQLVRSLSLSCLLHAAAGCSTARAKPVGAHLPLVLEAEVALPGAAARFDYQDIDATLGHLVIAHMNDDAVLIVNLKDGSTAARLSHIQQPRGVCVAAEIGVIFVTSAANQLILIDHASLTELARVRTGRGPDGVAWDATDHVVGVSDQRDGALSLIADAGHGKRTQLRLGTEAGNVAFDRVRGWFWVTVVGPQAPDRLVAVDPVAQTIVRTVPLPGCHGAHGLRVHPDGKSAFIACEANALLVRVELDSPHAIASATTGRDPDVLDIDPGLGWLYVAAETGELTVFDIRQARVVSIGRDRPGDRTHSVAIDVSTHRVFFPVARGTHGSPVLRIMRPSGL